MIQTITDSERDALLMTLRELKQQIEVAIGCIELDALTRQTDDHWRPDPFDFKIGNFGITRIGGVDLLAPWKEKR